jgi:hypothetical protein
MEIPVIRMCDGDMYASYQGRYGVGGDVYATGGATETVCDRAVLRPPLLPCKDFVFISRYSYSYSEGLKSEFEISQTILLLRLLGVRL